MFEPCPSCKFAWSSRDDFLSDPGVVLIGYEASFLDLMAGLFLFHHCCDAVVTLHAGEFADLYDGPMFSEARTGREDCPGYCISRNELRPCSAKCECAYVREIVQIVNAWPKVGQPASETIARRRQPL